MQLLNRSCIRQAVACERELVHVHTEYSTKLELPYHRWSRLIQVRSHCSKYSNCLNGYTYLTYCAEQRRKQGWRSRSRWKNDSSISIKKKKAMQRVEVGLAYRTTRSQVMKCVAVQSRFEDIYPAQRPLHPSVHLKLQKIFQAYAPIYHTYFSISRHGKRTSNLQHIYLEDWNPLKIERTTYISNPIVGISYRSYFSRSSYGCSSPIGGDLPVEKKNMIVSLTWCFATFATSIPTRHNVFITLFILEFFFHMI